MIHLISFNVNLSVQIELFNLFIGFLLNLLTYFISLWERQERLVLANIDSNKRSYLIATTRKNWDKRDR